MEHRVSKASTVSIITAFTSHQLSIDIFFSLLSVKYDIKTQNASTSEGSWDKILHSKSRTQWFSKEEFFSDGLSLEAVHQSSESSFRDFFVKTTKES